MFTDRPLKLKCMRILRVDLCPTESNLKLNQKCPLSSKLDKGGWGEIYIGWLNHVVEFRQRGLGRE